MYESSKTTVYRNYRRDFQNSNLIYIKEVKSQETIITRINFRITIYV